MRIIAATQNINKLNEISHITKDFGMGLVSQAEAGLGHLNIEETGSTCVSHKDKSPFFMID